MKAGPPADAVSQCKAIAAIEGLQSRASARAASRARSGQALSMEAA